ncbi:MAG: PEP-CTERM sorting domain-containing protein [Acidobacteria bacterium]|nr:PEP-CTERM sorting domain-containing protein [Acidobacteriota bacterium]
MTNYSFMRKLLTFALLTPLAITTAKAASVTIDLTCVLNGINAVGCVNGTSFGTVTLASTADPNQIALTVDLAGTGQKFRDLMLNYNGASTSITSTDGLASLVPDGFSITPYGGLFDVGKSSGQGWNGDDLYSTILTGNNGLLLANFLITDSLGNLYVAMHIQNIGGNGGSNCSGNDDGTTGCIPGQTGPGSLKIGGTDFFQSDVIVPEPASFALASLGLALLLARGRIRKALR